MEKLCYEKKWNSGLTAGQQTDRQIYTRQMLVASWGEPEVQQHVHCITQSV